MYMYIYIYEYTMFVCTGTDKKKRKKGMKNGKMDRDIGDSVYRDEKTEGWMEGWRDGWMETKRIGGLMDRLIDN